jgi:hypothetical protein
VNGALGAAADLRKLTDEDNHEAFHDFRKQLRAATKLAGYLPQLFQGGDPENRLGLLIEAADRYGDVNDKIIARALAVENGDDAKAAALADEIKTKWKDLRGWQRDVGLSGLLRERRAAILEKDRER